MKKLLLSAITALAFLFGFASCSGDLHDVGTTDISQLYVKGTLPGLTWDDDVKIGSDTETAKTPFVRQDDGSYVWEFVAVSSSAAFAFDIGGWTETYRGTAKDELFEDFDADFNTGAVEGIIYPHDDGDCMPITMEAGASYKMTVTGGAGTVICKIEKTKDAINMKLVTPDESIALTPVNATDVQYEFTPEADGELKFYVVNGVINIAPDSDRELELGVPFAPKADFTSTEPTGWYKFQYKANMPYKVVVSYTEEGISITAGYSFVAAGLESIGWGRNSFETEGDGYGWTESFNATAIEYDRIEDGYAYYKPVEFSVTNATTIGADIALRNNESWSVRYELGGGKELTQDEWHKLEKGLDPGNGRAYIKFAAQEGKVADKIKVSYRENLSDNSVEVSYTVVYKTSAGPTYYTLEGKYIHGNYCAGDWAIQEGGAPAFTAVSDKEHTFSVDVKVDNEAGWTEFGVIKSATTDKDTWDGGLGFDIKELDKPVEGSTTGGNSKIADGVAKFTGVYTLTVEVIDTNGTLKATLTQKTAPQE